MKRSRCCTSACSVWFSSILTATVLVVIGPMAAIASGPTGTITCDVIGEGQNRFGQTLDGIVFRPGTNFPGRVRLFIENTGGGTCDSSEVMGGKAPISEVWFRMKSWMSDVTCPSFPLSPELDRARIKIIWRGMNSAGKSVTVGVSKATIAQTSFESETDSLVLTTNPVEQTGRSAFTGVPVTLRLGLGGTSGDLASWISLCEAGAQLAGLQFGTIQPATVSVP